MISRRRIRTATAAALGLGALAALAPTLGAQEWWVAKPSNTGIPGEEVSVVRWAPGGDVWVGARWPFWGQGGIGVRDLESEVWTVWSDWETPLPSPQIRDVEFDGDGVAWIATGGGLVRWDGEEWTVHDPSNSPLAFPNVRNLAVAPDGHVWVNNSDPNHAGDAIWEFDGVSTWVQHAVPDDLPWPAPWTDLENVFVDSRGHAWVSNSTLSGVAEYDGERWVLHGSAVDKFGHMAEDHLGNLWLVSDIVGGQDAFYRWDGESFTTYPFPQPTTVAFDPDEQAIYVGNWFGSVLRTFDGGETLEPFTAGLNQVFSIAPDPAGSDVWLGTIGAVLHFDGSGASVAEHNSYNTGVPWYWIERFDLDAQGNFWLATDEAGLSLFDGLRWRNWGAHNLGSEPYPFEGNEPMGGAYQDASGTHWFGGNGIARWDDDTGTFTGFWNWQNNPGMGVSLYQWFAEDAAGNLFAGAEHSGIWRFDAEASLWVKEFQPYAPGGLPGMETDSQGDVWVADWFDLHRWDGTSWSEVTLPDEEYFLDKGRIRAMAIAPDDVIWLGTGDGIVRYDGTGFTHLPPSSVPLAGANVNGIDVRADGLIAASSRGLGGGEPSGVSLIEGDATDPASWTTYLYGETPLPHWQVERCAFDPRGDLWVSAASEAAAVLRVGAWADLGSALAGSHGEPHLLGAGIPVAGEDAVLNLTDAVAGAPGIHVVGLSQASLPFLGGLLVPSPDLVIPFSTDASGAALAIGPWPSGMAQGSQMFFQSWIVDPLAPQGAAGTNALGVTVP